MIRLKQLLLEQISNKNKQANVLFIGDQQTAYRNSYANRILKSEEVTGNVVGKWNISANELNKLLRRKLKESYNVVVVQFGIDQIQKDTKTDIQYLNQTVDQAKTYGATVILVITPFTGNINNINKQSLDTARTLIDSIIADDVIDISNIGSSGINPKTRSLSSTINRQLQVNIIDSINNLLNVDIEDIGQDDEEYEDLGPAPKNAAEFINMWKTAAIANMNQYGIPASITLAQAGLESGWGTSRLARQGNNYFGIKCHGWSGEKIYADDDHPNECFRKYKDASESFTDHSLFLKNNGRYASLFNLKSTDYEGWAKGLKAAGYATSDTYAGKLINIIKSYGLNKYDTGSTDSVSTTDKIEFDMLQPDIAKYLSLPFKYQDLSGLATYKRKGEPLKADKYFIIHHTAGRGTATGVMNTLNKRELAIQWVVDREGNIYQMLPRGSRGAHIRNSDLGPNNSNSQGVEVIAKNDSDVLPVQAAAVLKLVQALGYSPNQIYGHGEVNSHKQKTEGQTIKQYILKNYSK